MKLTIEELTPETFDAFGTYCDPRDTGMPFGGSWGRVNFFPDRLIMRFAAASTIGVSPLIVRPESPMRADVIEYHSDTEEIVGGFTQDMAFHLAPPTWGKMPDMASLKAFRLPKGWWLRLKRGVWHWGPFVLGNEEAVGTVILLPATYTADTVLVKLAEPVEVVSP